MSDMGYGRKRLLFWPWHYIQHVRRGVRNGYYRVPYGTGASGSAWAAPRMFCTWCVDDRMRDFYATRPADDAGERP